MKQKDVLAYGVEFAIVIARGDPFTEIAAQAFMIISWLEDMNLNSEAAALTLKVRSESILATPFDSIANDDERKFDLYYNALMLRALFKATLLPSDWRATNGRVLVEELWEIINKRVLSLETT